MTEGYRNALAEQFKLARQEREDDYEHWTRLATGQDTEEAEHSGYLSGYEDGLSVALSLFEAMHRAAKT